MQEKPGIKSPTADCLMFVYQQKGKENLSHHFLKDLRSYINRLALIVEDEVRESTFQAMVNTHPNWNNTSFNNFKRYASLIEKGLQQYGYTGNWSKKVKRRRQAETLHKKINNQHFQLTQLYAFNKDLHLCALLTYGCLLRPHKEIRELTWGDFNSDLTQVSLVGSRNKSKRNRIIPVPDYLRESLKGGEPQNNIFTGKPKPYNPYYFSLLRQRLKAANPGVVEKGQTLYSYRHTGAIAVYEKTKNIKVLQTVMGHSDMSISLTYLRGLHLQNVELSYLPDF